MQFSFHLFILLFGFVLGNLFPTFFGDFLGKVGTPLFLFLALDFFIYFYYSHQKRWKIRTLQSFENSQTPPVEKEPTSLAVGEKVLKATNSASSLFSRNGRQKKMKQGSSQSRFWFWRLPFLSASKVDSHRIRFEGENSFLSSFSARANSFKIGFLFGLFVDAFKVGS